MRAQVNRPSSEHRSASLQSAANRAQFRPSARGREDRATPALRKRRVAVAGASPFDKRPLPGQPRRRTPGPHAVTRIRRATSGFVCASLRPQARSSPGANKSDCSGVLELVSSHVGPSSDVFRPRWRPDPVLVNAGLSLPGPCQASQSASLKITRASASLSRGDSRFCHFDHTGFFAPRRTRTRCPPVSII